MSSPRCLVRRAKEAFGVQVGCFQALDVAARVALGTQEAPELPVFRGTTVREGRAGEGNAGVGAHGIRLLGSESQLVSGLAGAPVCVGESDSRVLAGPSLHPSSLEAAHLCTEMCCQPP